MQQKTIRILTSVILGNIILAFTVAAFAVPAGLVMGGGTGIALSLQHYVPGIGLSLLIFSVNILLFIVGAFVMGKKFALTTIVSTILYPVLLQIFQSIPGIDSLTNDMLLLVIYNGLLLGLGVAMIVRVGSSTGGSDIIAIVLNKKVRLPLATALYAVDFVIIALQATYATAQQMLYGILSLLIVTFVVGKVTVLGQSQTQLFIISEHYEEIKQALLVQNEVGATLVHIETGRQQKEQSAVLCIIPKRKLYEVNEVIQDIDPRAFITISEIHEVHGQGFSLERVYT